VIRKLVNDSSKRQDFWKILKDISGSNRNTPSTISTDSWYELFNPSLNTEDTEEKVTEQDIQMNIDIKFYILNMDFAEEEILNAIKSLKVNKLT